MKLIQIPDTTSIENVVKLIQATINVVKLPLPASTEILVKLAIVQRTLIVGKSFMAASFVCQSKATAVNARHEYD